MADAAFPEPSRGQTPEEQPSLLPRADKSGEPRDGVMRQDSMRHMEKANQLDDVSEQLSQEPMRKRQRATLSPEFC